MQKVKTLLSVGIIALGVSFASVSPALAWHPVGKIVKKVQNVTTGSALSDANVDAVAAKPGDTLKYVIEVRNDGTVDERGYNDMAKTVMTDTLPAGVELIATPSQRTITENLGLIKPKQMVAKEYLVKVVSTKDGVIDNTACFTGDSTANDKPQKGCDNAKVKVVVPPKTPPVVPTPPATPTLPATIPATGPEAILGMIAGVTAVTYGAFAYLRSKRNLINSIK